VSATNSAAGYTRRVIAGLTRNPLKKAGDAGVRRHDGACCQFSIGYIDFDFLTLSVLADDHHHIRTDHVFSVDGDFHR